MKQLEVWMNINDNADQEYIDKIVDIIEKAPVQIVKVKVWEE